MKKNFLYNILLATSLVGITACSDDVAGSRSVGESDNEIQFVTGVVSGNMTRASYNTENYTFLPLTEGTKLHIKTEGTWKGDVTHYTQTGTAGAAAGTQSPITGVGIYWDDYGTGDPANTANRATGINVYAACVDGKDASAIGTISNWENLSWTLPADMATWKDKDLLVSNNNSDDAENIMNKVQSGRYKFDTQKAGTACNLELHHAMSKITVNLKAGKGFPVEGGVAKFEKTPSVTLQSVKLGGTVNIKTMTATASGSATTASLVAATTPATGYTTTMEGLVFPGNTLSATTDVLAKIDCDGNIFNIYAEELMKAMSDADADYVFHSGKNYVLNITVDKTDIMVTATVVDWIDVKAADETPLINVTTSYGQEGNNFGKGFSFLRSTTIDNGYAQDAKITYTDGTYAMTPQLYWPNHSTHYFFRGVWPLIGEDGTPEGKVSASAITVANVAYSQGTYPSDLMIGYPRTTTETCPHGKTVATTGICATEGEIRMNFQYVMSQVEVNLQTSEGSDKVIFDEHTAVEIVGAYTAGTILLSDGSATLSTKTDYTMHRKGSSDVAYHDAIIPQDVTALKFRITVTDTDGNQDKYETVFTISNIKVIEDEVEKDITAWEPGKHYVYNLVITKTGIKVIATIKDWVTATGGTNIWM